MIAGKRARSRNVFVGLSAVLLAGCASQTRIDSDPPHARVYIGDDFVGFTPVDVHLSSAVRAIRLEQPGYRTVTGMPRRRWDSRAITALLFPPAFLFPSVTTRPYDFYKVVLPEGEGTADIGVIEGTAQAPED